MLQYKVLLGSKHIGVVISRPTGDCAVMVQTMYSQYVMWPQEGAKVLRLAGALI